MFSESKRRDHCTGCDEVLLGAVPADCRRILEVGCAEGTLGAALKAMAPFREVLGIEREPEIAAQAARRLDAVFVLDVEKQDPPVEPGSLDCILFGDVLEHLLDPEAVLRRYRRFLNRSGVVLCSIPNVQHHSVLTALCKSDFQYTGAGLLDATHVRFFTYSTIIKLLLDSGFAPVLIGAIDIPCPADLLNAAQPLLRYLGLHPERTQRYLSAYQYIVRGTPLRHESGNGETDTRWNGCSKAEAETPLSFVTCVSNEATLEANLLASPCLGPGSPHEVILLRHCRTAADGLNQGLLRAKHSVVVCLHQDVYLPRGWPARFLQKYRKAEQALGQLGVVGVYGVSRSGDRAARAGHVVDRDRLLVENQALPAVVDTLDELLLALPRGTPLAFDPRLGFHFYGADIALAARQRGLGAVVVDAPCFHNSLSVGLPKEFFASAAAFAAKWSAQLPLATSCVFIDRNGGMRLS